jgi:glycosyltransferase involved in cell wall biosynthesis
MKILFLTLEYPPIRGGVASYLMPLVKNALEGDEVKVLVPPKGEHWLKTAFRMNKANENSDVIVISHAIPMGYVAMLRGKKFVAICHGTDILTARRSKWKRFLFRFVLKHATLVIANSKFTANLLAEEGFNNVEVVYPSVVVNLNPKPYTLNANIISVGRLVPRKGFDTLIKTMPEIIKKLPNAQLTIIGNGSCYEELVRLAHELRVENFVDIVTSADDNARNKFYDKASVFVLPTRKEGADVEGFGIVVLEASAHGLPVIVGNSGGVAEAVIPGKTGFLIDPTDNTKLAETVINLLTDTNKARQMGEAGIAFSKEFSPEKIADKFWNLIHNAINSPYPRLEQRRDYHSSPPL